MIYDEILGCNFDLLINFTLSLYYSVRFITINQRFYLYSFGYIV